MDKKILVFLCCTVLCFCWPALAEEPSANAVTGNTNNAVGEVTYGPLADAAELPGLWACCGANDAYPYLVFHTDGTMEAYGWWQAGAEGDLGLGLMLLKGAYTFDANAGSLTMPNGETYAVSLAETPEELETSDGTEVEDAPYVLYWEGEQDGEPYEMGYVPIENIACFPDAAELCCEGRSWSNEKQGTTYRFTEDGAYTVTAADGETAGTYTLEGGRLCLTANDAAETLYIQFRCVPYEGLTDEQMDELDAQQDEYGDESSLALYTQGDSAFLDRGTLQFYSLDGAGEAVSFTRCDAAAQ